MNINYPHNSKISLFFSFLKGYKEFSKIICSNKEKKRKYFEFFFFL